MENESRLIYHMAFSSLKGMTRLMSDEIIARTGSEEEFFRLSSSQLSAVMGMRNRMFDDAYRSSVLASARTEAAFVLSNNIRAIYHTDAEYPARLLNCDDAPLMLFCLGSADLNPPIAISVVGTRHATPYGINFVERLIEELARKVSQPVTVISGLAFGIDIAAHRAALKVGLPTIAVLAHGLNTLYPAQHRSEAAAIVRSGGALVTEYTTAAAIHRGFFLARNRIVAGMADCVTVAESDIKGGAIVTAKLAQGYMRDVFALPGRISDRYSRGCNGLIAANIAALVENAEDVIRQMSWPEKPETEAVQTTLFAELTPEEKRVVDYLTEHGEGRLNVMSVALDINVGRLMSLLIDMEFKGLVLPFPGGIYHLA